MALLSYSEMKKGIDETLAFFDMRIDNMIKMGNANSDNPEFLEVMRLKELWMGKLGILFTELAQGKRDFE